MVKGMVERQKVLPEENSCRGEEESVDLCCASWRMKVPAAEGLGGFSIVITEWPGVVRCAGEIQGGRVTIRKFSDCR